MTSHVVRSQRRVAAAAWALALLLLTTGTWHFASPDGFASIVPGFLGSPAFWVAASGALELAGAVALAFRPTRRIAGWACGVLFVVVFPANIKMAFDALDGHGSLLVAWLRLPLQDPTRTLGPLHHPPDSSDARGPAVQLANSPAKTRPCC